MDHGQWSIVHANNIETIFVVTSDTSRYIDQILANEFSINWAKMTFITAEVCIWSICIDACEIHFQDVVAYASYSETEDHSETTRATAVLQSKPKDCQSIFKVNLNRGLDLSREQFNRYALTTLWFSLIQNKLMNAPQIWRKELFGLQRLYVRYIFKWRRMSSAQCKLFSFTLPIGTFSHALKW